MGLLHSHQLKVASESPLVKRARQKRYARELTSCQLR
jgi:hypothetical protein